MADRSSEGGRPPSDPPPRAQRHAGARGLGLDEIANLDWGRTQRRGYPEAVYCAEKTAEQVGLIAAAAGERPEVTTLFTRANAEHADAVLAALPDARHDALAQLLVWPPEPPGGGPP